MTEFGHSHGAIRSGHGVAFIDSWGAGPYLIEAGGKTFRFEDSDRFGPNLVNKDGSVPNRCHPGQRSKFWRAHWLWIQQGRQVKPDKMTCIWREPRPTIYQRIGDMTVVIEHGEPDYGHGGIVQVKIEAPKRKRPSPR